MRYVNYNSLPSTVDNHIIYFPIGNMKLKFTSTSRFLQLAKQVSYTTVRLCLLQIEVAERGTLQLLQQKYIVMQ